jgi:hypothetical protein
MEQETFTLTEDHLKLMQRMYVGWQYCEFGAPEIDPKRPYGNGDVCNDVAEILGLDSRLMNEDDSQYDEGMYDRLEALHKETETALQIVLTTLSFEPGVYKREWLEDWKQV